MPVSISPPAATTSISATSVLRARPTPSASAQQERRRHLYRRHQRSNRYQGVSSYRRFQWSTWHGHFLGPVQGSDQADGQGERSDPCAQASDLPLQEELTQWHSAVRLSRRGSREGEPRSSGSRRRREGLHRALRSGERDAAQRVPERASQSRESNAWRRPSRSSRSKLKLLLRPSRK